MAPTQEKRMHQAKNKKNKKNQDIEKSTITSDGGNGSTKD